MWRVFFALGSRCKATDGGVVAHLWLLFNELVAEVKLPLLLLLLLLLNEQLS